MRINLAVLIVYVLLSVILQMVSKQKTTSQVLIINTSMTKHDLIGHKSQQKSNYAYSPEVIWLAMRAASSSCSTSIRKPYATVGSRFCTACLISRSQWIGGQTESDDDIKD